MSALASPHVPRGGEQTAAEIAQQPQLWRQAAVTAVDARGAWAAVVGDLLSDSRVRVVLTGAGTSAYAGQVLAPALAARLGRRVDAVATTDIVSNPREAFAEDVPTVLVSFARSGDSPESAEATQLADGLLGHVVHLVLTCNPQGRLALEHGTRGRSFVLHMPEASHDLSFAMTSSFTCMLLSAWLLLSRDDDSHDTRALGEVDVVASAAERLLAERVEEVEAMVRAGYDRVVYLGSGAMSGLAREAALKMLELTAGRLVSFADSSLGFRHGPKAVVRPGTLAVVLCSPDAHARQYDHDIADELAEALGGRHVLALTAGDDTWAAGTAAQVWPVVPIDALPAPLAALPAVVVVQLLALRASEALGISPDNPFPDGSVNRVVQGVVLHPLDGRQ